MKPWSQFLTGVGMSIFLLGLVAGSFITTFVESGKTSINIAITNAATRVFLPEPDKETATPSYSATVTEYQSPTAMTSPTVTLTPSHMPATPSLLPLGTSALPKPSSTATIAKASSTSTTTVQPNETPTPSPTFTLIIVTIISRPSVYNPASLVTAEFPVIYP